MLKFSRLIFTILALGLICSQDVKAEPSESEGKELFRNQCASCHNRNMKDKLTGPPLGPAEANWAAYPRQDLYDWIRNSQAMIAKGHPHAVKLWNEWKSVMNAFPNLTDEQIESILLYVNNTYTGAGQTAAAPGAATAQTEAPAQSNTIYYILFAILILLAAFLANIIYNLNYLARRQAGEDLPAKKTVYQVLTSKGVVAFVVFTLVVLGGYTTVNNAIALGRQQGYAPDQPIKFSHATHAGLHKIDCQYCHDGARRSKQSIIPAANTCMNCHKAIKTGSQFGTAEISKIFASIGFDPNTDKYIENYESMSEEEIEKVFKKWIADSYIEENGNLDTRGDMMVDQQWAGIKTSLTNDVKKTIPGPIEWVRIHNLPDHAYFNHAQHVTVGKVECQTCHGKVEEMDVVRQYSPLSMGWCINCHRQTEVKFGENEYYKNYQRYHDEIKSGKRTGVTVEEIGGLECQKCHY
jgi:mono/diheme cytochrome c family protein